EPDKIGGRLSLNGDLLNLERRNGPEMRRVSGGTQWRLPFNGPIGDRFVFSIGTRLDAYQSDNVQVGDNSSSNQSVASGRVFPQGALQWRYPWVRHDPGMSEVIEPMPASTTTPMAAPIYLWVRAIAWRNRPPS